MLSLVLGLLLAGPEPATHGFLTMSHPPPDGDTYQGYAKNVVRHPHDSNFNDTMHKTEVTTCMAPSNAYQHVTPELTALLHNAQREQVHPRGPSNPRDVNQNTTGPNLLLLAGDHPEGLDSGYNTTGSICASGEYNTTLIPRRLTAGVPSDPWWDLHLALMAELQHYVHKPLMPPKSRRRRRYEGRLRRLSRLGGRVKRRRRLGRPGANNQSVVPRDRKLKSTVAENAHLASRGATIVNSINHWTTANYHSWLAVTIVLFALDAIANVCYKHVAFVAEANIDVVAGVHAAYLASLSIVIAMTTWMCAVLAIVTLVLHATAAVSPAAAYRATYRLLYGLWAAVKRAYYRFGLCLCWLVILLVHLHYARAMNDDATSSSTKLRPPSFSGERTDYTQWLIAFTIWVALYLQECSSLLEGEDPEPESPDDLPDGTAEHEVAAVRFAHDRWNARNRKLFGAIAMAMPKWLMQSLYASCRNDGVLARNYMRESFSAVAGSGNDRAAAITRLQQSHIDAKADLCEQDVRTQYDSMMIAVADLEAAGAAAPDQPMLISMFENALPASYTVIRQMVRRQNHTTLLSYYTDVLREVRAELQSRAPSAHAFSATAAPKPGESAAAGSSDPQVAILVAALQALGYDGKSDSRNNRNAQNQNDRERKPYPSEPCLICGKEGHQREKCRKAATASPCRFCGKTGHAPPYCPHNPTAGGKRRALTSTLRALVDREAGPTPLPNVASTSSASAAPATYAAVAGAAPFTEEQAQAAAAAAASQHADPSAMATAYVAALKACGYASCAALAAASSPLDLLPAAARASPPALSRLVSAFVDSMATYFVVDDAKFLVRVTNDSPAFGVNTADGVKPVVAVGVAHMWIPDPQGTWCCYEVPNVLLMPKCGQILYSVRIMRDLFRFRHDFDVGLVIRMPDRSNLPMHDNGASFTIAVAFSTTPVDASRRIAPAGDVSALAVSAFQAGSVGTPQSLLYQRLAYPYAQAWRHVSTSTRGHNLPPGIVLSSSLPVREAVMRGRARALPFFTKPPEDRTPPPPGAVIYMDFAGPVSPSFPHGLTTYCGAIDAGSLYGRVMAAHTMTRDIASQTLSLILSDIASKMKSAVPIKPFVVNCDNGSAFISRHFREFLADRQIRLRFSPPYTPQLNGQIESMWCTTFATARVLLAAASLPPSLHPFAMQTARWIENRLPKPTRGNQTPVYMLSKELPDLSYLYTFGCLCLVTLPHPLREGDSHFMDRGSPGLYLGPSEEGLCHIVYVFALRRILPTAKIRVWEDQFPGLRGHYYKWFPSPPELSAIPEGPVSTDLPSNNNNVAQTPISNNNAAAPALPANAASSPLPPIAAPSPPPLVVSSPPTAAVPLPTAIDPATPSDTSGTATVTEPGSSGNTPKLPKGDSGDPSDPQSRTFARTLPSRASRNSNPNYSSIAGQAALAVACTTFHRLHSLIAHSLASPGRGNSDPYIAGPAIAFACHSFSTDAAFVNFGEGGDNNLMTSLEVAATICAAGIVSTTDYGDIPIPRGYKAAMSGKWADYWRAAIDKELAGLVALRTWDLVPTSSIPRGSNIMNCHYVFDVKRLRDATVEKFKARLVADGNTQKYGVDYNRIFATVVKTATIRLVLAVAAARDYNLTQIDIRQAYLQAELPEKLYMRVPPGVPAINEQNEPLVCQLNRTLYGLKQAGREWGTLFASFLVSWGFVRSSIDTCMFTYAKSDLLLWILVYVDDCIIVDNDAALRSRFIADLSKRFPVDDRGELEWMLGIAVHRDRPNRVLTLSQELYINDLVERYAPYIRAGHNRKYDTPMEEGLRLSHDDCPAPDSEEARLMAPLKPVYMALVGAFLWLGNMTYSEISHVAAQLARFVSNHGPKHFDAATRVLIYLDGKRGQALRFEPDPSLPLHVYVDSSWETKFSCSGAYYFFMGCCFHWFSKMQRSVSLSSAESEFFGCMLALKDTLWIRQLLLDLGVFAPGPTPMWCDSKSAVDLALDPVAFKHTKHILRAAEFLKDHVLRGSVTISHLKGSTMIADILTKGQARPVFLQLLKLLHGYSKNPVAYLTD